MKKNLLKLVLALVSCILALYLIFLITPFILNHTLDFKTYKKEIQKIALENAKLNLNYSKIKFFTTPALSVGASIDEVNITLDDGSTLFNSPKIKAGISLPSLLLLTVKTSDCYIEEPYINLEIVDDKQYKIVKIIEDIINENNSKPKEEVSYEENNLLNKIKIKVPSVKITNYLARITDLKSSHSLVLKGDKLILGYDSVKNTAKLQTAAKLLSDENENIIADIKISSSIPKFEQSKEEADPEEKIQIPFVNPITIYQTYDLKANAKVNLKIRETKNHGFVSRGYANIDNLNLKLSDIRLPDSFLHAKFQGKKIEYNSDIYAKNDEKLSLEGILRYGKKAGIKTRIVSQKIHFSNLLELAEGLLDSLNIKNDLASIQATGFLSADAEIKTNFKKLKSHGLISINDGSFVNPKSDIGIKDITLNLIFDNNAMNIKDTKAVINGSKLSLDGSIDNKSNTNIKLDIDNLSIPALYNAFAPRELKKEYNLNSLNLTAHVDIKGKLEKLNTILKTELHNLALSDRRKTIFITNKSAGITLSANQEKISGTIENDSFNISMPQIKTKGAIDKISLAIDNNNITINPFDIIYNNLSKITVKGNISNYLKNPNIDMFVDSSISTVNIKETLGRELSYYMASSGSVPIKVSVKGNDKKQDIIAQIYCDKNNYITPVNFSALINSPSLMQANISVKGNKIKIKNSGLYKKAQNGFSANLEENTRNALQLIDLAVITENNHINLFRLNIPQELDGQIAVFKQSAFKTKGKLTLNGNIDNLNFGGDLKLKNISIPELMLAIKDIDINLLSQSALIKARDINVNGSKIEGSLKADLKPSDIFKISDINIYSDYINVDKAMLSANSAMKYMPPAQNSKANAKNANIPLSAEGKFNIKKITTGEMLLENIKGNLAIRKNNLLIEKLSCRAFEGSVEGNVSMNLISGLIGAQLKGRDINADTALTKAANMKDTISGTTKFETDISLKGATYQEQMKTLSGKVLFEIKNGQYGPFSKLENFFLAENVRENPLFKNTIGVILTPLATIDSSRFEKLSGEINFKNGIAHLNSISSQGDILCVLIKGNMNLITNTIDSNVKVRLASAVSDMLGPLALANPVNLVKNTPGLNIASAKLFSVFTEVTDEKTYKEIPSFSAKHSDSNATKFQIILNGDVSKPLKLVKSFKWLALQEDMDKAEEFSRNYIKEQEDIAKQALIKKLQGEYEENNKLKVGVEKILKMDTTAPEVKKILVEEVIKTKNQAIENATVQLEDKKEEFEKKVQNKIETRTKERTEKLQNIKEQLKSKLPSIQHQEEDIDEDFDRP